MLGSRERRDVRLRWLLEFLLRCVSEGGWVGVTRTPSRGNCPSRIVFAAADISLATCSTPKHFDGLGRQSRHYLRNLTLKNCVRRHHQGLLVPLCSDAAKPTLTRNPHSISMKSRYHTYFGHCSKTSFVESAMFYKCTQR